MQKLKTFFSVSLLNLLFIAPAFAAAPAATCNKDTIHCAYITGLTPAYDNGRYIKITDKGRSYTSCVTGNATYEIPNAEGKDYVGNNKDNFYICKSLDGNSKTCELIKTDIFTVVDMGNYQYKAIPAGTPIDLSTVEKDYPRCRVFASEHQLDG